MWNNVLLTERWKKTTTSYFYHNKIFMRTLKCLPCHSCLQLLMYSHSLQLYQIFQHSVPLMLQAIYHQNLTKSLPSYHQHPGKQNDCETRLLTVCVSTIMLCALIFIFTPILKAEKLKLHL